MLDFVQPAGSDGRAVSLGSHGRTKPTGGVRRRRGALPAMVLPELGSSEGASAGWTMPQPPEGDAKSLADDCEWEAPPNLWGQTAPGFGAPPRHRLSSQRPETKRRPIKKQPSEGVLLSLANMLLLHASLVHMIERRLKARRWAMASTYPIA
jgi:hypothetical protein